jgi:superoxide dismutase, Fe-Mn family
VQEALASAAMSQCGSGWAWLVLDGAKLRLVKTFNAHGALAKG